MFGWACLGWSILLWIVSLLMLAGALFDAGYRRGEASARRSPDSPPRRRRPRCHFCGREVSSWHFCYGCRVHVCQGCDLMGPYGAPHRPASHRDVDLGVKQSAREGGA